MAFGPGLHVFPGGRVDPGDANPDLIPAGPFGPDDAAAALGGNVPPVDAAAIHLAALRELFEEAGVLLAEPAEPAADTTDAILLAVRRAGLLDGTLDLGQALRGLRLRLRPDLLVPIAHWTTPAFMPRRFSTWFFVADLPAGANPAFAEDEVAAHRWLTPTDALELMARGEIQMWVPTTSTLQRLIETGARTADELRGRLAFGRIEAPDIVARTPERVRVTFGAAGGLPGRRAAATLYGRRELVLVDPGDATDEALAAIRTAADRRGAAVRAIVLTSTDPDHAAGAEAFGIPLELPVLVAPGAGRHLPYPTVEVGDGEPLPADVELRVRIDPGRPGELRIEGPSAGE